MNAELPYRPRVLPGLAVLRRRAGELQVGLDPRHAAVVAGLPESVVMAAGGLTGQRTSEDLLTDVGADPAGPPAMRELLSTLVAKGLVEDAAEATGSGRLLGERQAHTARRDAAVVVHGDGRLAVSVACLLAAAGVGRVHVATRGFVRPEDVGTGYRTEDVGRTRLSAAGDALRRADGSVRTGRPASRRRPDLVLLTDAVVPDPQVVQLLTADSVAHLPVHIRDGVGIVGPLVLPGRTSCLRCADLRRTQMDGCWPAIAAQLAGRPQLGDLACTQATAGFAAAQALDMLRWSRCAQDRPQTWNTSVEIDVGSASTRYRGWRPHPECPCRGVVK